MSKSFNHRNRQLNETLRRCKGGVHDEKQGHQAKRSIQKDQARKEIKNHHWDWQ